MRGKIKRIGLRVLITARQNWAALAFAGAWVVVNGLVFAGVIGLSPGEAFLAAICVHKAGGTWGRLYASFTELVVFGALASLIVADATRRYRPESTCAALAASAKNHLVVVGLTNLGKRVRAMAEDAGATVVVVEEDKERVEALVRAEEPLAIGSAREVATLQAASVGRAKVVVIAADELEVAAVACRIVRAENPSCKLVVRCSDEEVGQILARTYAARVLSTSRLAARFILGRAEKAGARRAVVLGQNDVGRRVAEELSGARIACQLVPETDDPAALERAGVVDADLIVVADDDLGKNLVRVARIRRLNPNAHVICRIFHDDAAGVLAQSPFRCTVLSTSRLSAEALADEGAFRDVGVASVAALRAKKG